MTTKFQPTHKILHDGITIPVCAPDGDKNSALYRADEWDGSAPADYEVTDGVVEFQGAPCGATLVEVCP
jgi:hypothetical protein